MFKILIDPGHGGTDRYNRGPTGYVEADGVLQISKHMKEYLEDGNCKVNLTRDKDVDVTITDRGQLADGYDLFISEHTNAGSSHVRGVEAFISLDADGSEDLADKLVGAIAKEFGIPNRGVKTKRHPRYPDKDYYGVIRNAKETDVKNMILFESMFHTNPESEQILLSEKGLRRIAKIQADVILDHFELRKSAYDLEKEEARRWAMENGITDGSNPTGNITREQYWVMERRFIKMMLDEKK